MTHWIMVLSLPLVFLIVMVIIGSGIFGKKTKYGFQKLKQFMVYFIEMYTVIFIGISAITYFESGSFIFWQSNESFFEYFQRGLAVYSTYQLFVFATLKLSVAADQDSYLAYKKVLRVVLQHIDNDLSLSKLKEFLEGNYESPMFSNGVRSSLSHLIEVIEEYSVITDNYDKGGYKKELVLTLNSQIIDVEHILETYNLAWMSSFLLYILK
ncbi:hypothetical protein [Virgibacillus sediminis]|uniref:DUF4760 domain-containing protein n=1 Tax=Virgibacillus sediminis TaxID=202260 RepID=A0ABV7A575_9BACI